MPDIYYRELPPMVEPNKPSYVIEIGSDYLYQQQTTVQDKLRSEADRVMRNLLSELQNSNFENPLIEQLLLKLQAQLQNVKGKKVYGYLQPHVKETVDRIVAELAKNPVLKKGKGIFYALHQFFGR